MELVKLEEIPTDIKDASLDDPMGLYKAFNDMEVLCREKKGIGLAGVQVGIPSKIFIVLDFPLITERIFYGINCSYKPVDFKQEASFEGCLSLPNKFFIVKRYCKILINGFRIVIDKGQPKITKVKDLELDSLFLGNVFQHEIDHTNGILISDIGKQVEVVN